MSEEGPSGEHEDAPATRQKRVKLVRKPGRSVRNRKKVRLIRRKAGLVPEGEVEPGDLLFDGDLDDDFEFTEAAERVRGMANVVADAVLPELVQRIVAQVRDDRDDRDELDVEAVSQQLPREVGDYLAEQTGGVRRELSRIVAREASRLLGRVDVAGEIQRIITSLVFEVRTDVRLVPDDETGRLKPDVTSRIRVRWQGDPSS